jgi:signal transduction histidine kinase
MNRALQFRRRLWAAGTVVMVILSLAFFFGFRSANQAENVNRWATHAGEVLEALAQLQLEKSRMLDAVRRYPATHDPGLPVQFQSNLQALGEELERLRVLTADDRAQQQRLAELRPLVAAQSEALSRAMRRDASGTPDPPGATSDWLASSPEVDHLRQLFAGFDANERAVLAARLAAVHASARETQAVLLLLGLLTAAIILTAGHLMQREILMRAQAEAGMRVAQEMLGLKNEEQRAELSHVIEDMHEQIRTRLRAEDVVRELNGDLEKRVRLRTIELEETNRELEAFSYSVSHDLRAPLRHLDGFSRILVQEYGPKLPDEAQHYLARIRSAATYMSELVEGLLQLSRVGRQPAQWEVCSLRALVEEARAEVLPEGQGRKIVWHIYSLPEVEGDPALLRQVLINLFSNAVKFTRQQRAAVIEVGSLEENGMNVVFVRDNGAGFDPRYADKLFAVFQRLHRQDEFEGTGIGLATAQRIMHKHRGRIWAESQPGKGATFYFSFPATTHKSRAQPQAIGAFG